VVAQRVVMQSSTGTLVQEAIYWLVGLLNTLAIMFVC
jgi:hypothetical protein